MSRMLTSGSVRDTGQIVTLYWKYSIVS